MLKEERQKGILDSLQHNGRVIAGELALRFGVSEDTIRRDLRDLAEAGYLVRVHGGGLPHSPAVASYTDRLVQAAEAKEGIARIAARFIQNGQVVLIDGGTTTLQVVRNMDLNIKATVITNSPILAAELARYPEIDILMVGGRLYKHSQVTTGAAAVEALKALRADLCLLGVCSLHVETGITVPDFEESLVKRAMLASSAQVMALASAEKLDTISTHIVGPISALTWIVTEPAVAENRLDAYRAVGVTVLTG